MEESWAAPVNAAQREYEQDCVAPAFDRGLATRTSRLVSDVIPAASKAAERLRRLLSSYRWAAMVSAAQRTEEA